MAIINFRGFGFPLVLFNYIGGLFLLNKIIPQFLHTYKEQYLALLVFHIAMTALNYLLTKYLNRKEIKHTFYEIRLENVVLIVGLIFLPILLLMGKDTIY